ncbi:MAG: hypothetical protein ACXAES_12020, partial [Promethearchaeota archaeon]
MLSSQFKELIKVLSTGNVTKFINLVDKFTENGKSPIISSKNYDTFEKDLEKAYYKAISKRLKSMKLIDETDFDRSKEDVAKIINYSDKLGIFIDASKIDVEGIISELHIFGLNNGIRHRIIELVNFFNRYNLFERDFTDNELKIIQEIKKDDELLAVNLKDVFGTVSDSLIFYVCKVMPYDYVKWIREGLSNPSGQRIVMSPNALRNWTDGFPIYNLIVRNLGRVEDFIKVVEAKQRSDNQDKDMIFIEFSPHDHYRIYRGEFHKLSEIHIVYPEIIKQHKESILNKKNYNFFSLSMVLIGGSGPEGLGFTYSTPRGEVVEICSDQKETEAIVIKFKQYLKRKFLEKLENEMVSLHIDNDIRTKVIDYLSDIIDPKDSVSYYNKNSILKKIRYFLLQIDEFQHMNEPKLEAIMEKIAVAISIILKRIKLKD